MKPVTIKGYLDHTRETQILKWKDGEKGVDVVTPFYTHLDSSEKACGILVNRGWMPWDLKDFRYDKIANTTNVSGVLYQGDAKHKYDQPNRPTMSDFRNVQPNELALLTQLPNRDEASQFMLKAVDLDPMTRTEMPDVPSSEEL